jgi:arylsulfatase A-like enzyme
MAAVMVLLAQVLPLAALQPAMAATTPNIIVVMVDDMDVRMVDNLPRLKTLLADHGLSFSSFYAPSPVCCPARASFLRGQYPHNTGVLANDPPQGGVSTFRARGDEESTVATWLQDAGYRTALIGKYLNGYENIPKHVPPGWDRWFVYAGKGKYTRYTMSDQGKLVKYGNRNTKKLRKQERDYQTDVLTEEAVEFVESTDAAQPFFLYLSPATPHEPATPAPRHKDAPVATEQAPRLPSFNEVDMSDKPAIWSSHPPLSDEDISAIDELYVKQLRSMYAVEDMIDEVMTALADTGRLDNSYIFFTSDNGLHHGEHRIGSEKNTEFEESIRVPLIVMGPDVPSGVTTDALTTMIDLGPTFADLAGVDPPGFVDGRSLAPILGGETPSDWRDKLISELLLTINGGLVVLRSGPYAYVEWGWGDRELYDLENDPYQLDNIYYRASQGVIDDLSIELDALATCGITGPATCQAVDGGN